MKNFSTEALSNEYLHVNHCGCDRLYGYDVGSYRPNGRVDWHILYIAEGSCFVTLNGKTVEVKEGNIILYFPNEPQEYRFSKDIKSVSYHIHFSGTACYEIMNKFNMTEKRIYYIGKNLALESLYSQMIAEYHLKRAFFEYTCQGYLLAILSIIAEKISSRDYGVENSANKIIEICKYMHNSYQNDIYIAEYAKMCNLSESRFSHLFKEITGISPARYMINIKTDKAKELLENTDLSISQISDMVGMGTQYYFSRIFKKITSLSPSEYRKCSK